VARFTPKLLLPSGRKPRANGIGDVASPGAADGEKKNTAPAGNRIAVVQRVASHLLTHPAVSAHKSNAQCLILRDCKTYTGDHNLCKETLNGNAGKL
jgi:hypothetical protein